MKEKDNFVLVLTATCNVDSQNKGSVFTTEERIKQYYNTVQWLLNYCSCKKYVICDNSGYDFSSFCNNFREVCSQTGKTVEYLSFVSSENRGKSYGETEILGYVFNNSELVKSSEYVFKLTGRIIVKNINKILSTSNLNRIYFQKALWPAGNDNSYYCECNSVLFGSPKMKLINTIQLFRGGVSDSNNIEKCFYDTFKKQNIQICFFNREPLFIGSSAGTGASYALNFGKWFIYNLLSTFRLRGIAFSLLLLIRIYFKNYKILNL